MASSRPIAPSSPGSTVRLEVFGGLRAERASRTGEMHAVGLGGRQERSLLALLVVHRGQPLSGERLVDLLWPDEPPPTAAKIVQVYVGRLRSTFGPGAIARTGDAYRLTGLIAVASDEFERLVTAGVNAVASDPLTALDRLDEALAGAIGEPFGTEADLHELRAAASRLTERRWQAQEARIELLLRLGRVTDVLAELPGLLAADPLRDSVRLTGIRALAIAGRRAEALTACDDAVRFLRDQLGVGPDQALIDLRARVAGGEPVGLPQIERPFARILPEQAAPFVGRVAELQDLCDRMRPGRSRIVTLTGAGGSGKTRLALEAGGRLARAFNDAVAYVDLSGARAGAEVWPVIRSVLGVEGQDGRALGDARCLLVIDNPERVEDVATALSALLRDAPRLQVLVASRVVVRVGGEEAFEVEPLDADDAATLFAARAAATGAAPEPRVVVDAICRRLDRLPLAIELAALRARALPGTELVKALSHRLPVLVGGADDGSGRHRTIEATIAWSYDLLPPPVQAVFVRLAVFEGGWTVPAASAVCGATLEDLQTLVDHSLVRRSGTRMTMLDTIHEFAAGRLDDSGTSAALLQRHAAWYLAEARRQDADAPPEQQYRILEDDVQNERLAMATLCAAPVTDAALELADLMWMTWVGQGRFAEGDAAFAAAAARPSTGRPSAWTLCAWGELPRVMGDLDRAEQLKLEALRRLRDDGPPSQVAAVNTDLAEIARARGDLGLARAHAYEAVAIRRSIGNPAGIVHSLIGLADVEADEGNLAVAASLLEEGMSYVRSVGRISREAGHFAAYVPLALARVRILQAKFDGTATLISEGLDAATQLRLVDAIAQGMALAAALSLAMGDLSVAARLTGAVEALRNRYGLPDGLVRELGDPVGTLIAALGAQETRDLMAAGAALGDEAAIRLATEPLEDAEGESLRPG